jgi:hypothetical protein
MNMIVLATSAGVRIAMLGLSTPVAPQRDCIFIIHPQPTAEARHEALESREGKIIFPGPATEYHCNYEKQRGGTLITFTNQTGWRFEVRIGRNDDGTWKASMDSETVSGRAFSPFGD